MKDKELQIEETEASHTLGGVIKGCLLLIDKARAKDKTYI
jgi:hypothetical protein